MASARRLLGIYLNDHLAGSVAGVELARRIAKQNEGNEYGREMAAVADEIEEDRVQLRRIMDRLGIRQKRIRLGIAWAGEKAGRLKPNGQLVGYSPLSRLIELEGLAIGITGKLSLWRSLERAGDAHPELEATEIKRLIDRAVSQRDRVESLRLNAAGEALE